MVAGGVAVMSTRAVLLSPPSLMSAVGGAGAGLAFVFGSWAVLGFYLLGVAVGGAVAAAARYDDRAPR